MSNPNTLPHRLPIILSIPVERAAPDLEIRPRHVKGWIEAQPLNITFETGRKLCRHLAAINRSHLDVNVRLEILEAYRPAAERILQELEAMYAAAPLPLAPARAPRSASRASS